MSSGTGATGAGASGSAEAVAEASDRGGEGGGGAPGDVKDGMLGGGSGPLGCCDLTCRRWRVDLRLEGRKRRVWRIRRIRRSGEGGGELMGEEDSSRMGGCWLVLTM